jgi:hypothetical protein
LLAWHLSGPRLAVNISAVSGPTSVTACEALVRQNLGFNEDASGCTEEIGMSWVRVTVRNAGYRGTPDFTCTATANTDQGRVTVDLPRPGGIPGTSVAARRTISWVTFVPVPLDPHVQSWRAECQVITNPPI